MNCREWTIEIVECSRAGRNLPAELEAHLLGCDDCHEIWDAEQSLLQPMSSLRRAVRGERSPDTRRVELLHEFDRLHPRMPPRRVHWAFGAAAAVLFALALGLSQRAYVRSLPDGKTEVATLTADRAVTGDVEEVLDDSGFVAVPYAPPLATGEFVKVVRTQLYAAALDRMGVSVPANNGEFPAEVVLGEDGLPRAVRVLADVQF